MKPHPQADLLMAIARGEQAQYFDEGTWYDYETAWSAVADIADGVTIRIKPRTIKIGDVEINAPMREAPAHGTYLYIVDMSSEELFCKVGWLDGPRQQRFLQRGLCFSTQEDAEACSRALLKPLEVK